MNILIVKLSAIGDVIHTLPALNALRAHYPSARITWLVEEAASDLVIGHEALDRVLISKRKRWVRELFSRSFLRGARSILKFIGELRDTRYDIIIDFHALLKSGVMVMLARGDVKLGFDKGMEHTEHSHIFLNTKAPPVDMEIHALTRGLILLESLGIYSRRVEYRLPVSEHDRLKIENFLDENRITPERPVIAINPEATWKTKLWSNDKFAELAHRLAADYDAQIIFTGGPGDRDAVASIVSKMEGKAFDLSGRTTLKTLAALYEKTDLLITTDTGPMHLGAAAGTRVVAIFGSTAPWRTGPFGRGHRIVRKNLPCSPCFKRQCDTGECMEKISVNDLLTEIRAAEPFFKRTDSGAR